MNRQWLILAACYAGYTQTAAFEVASVQLSPPPVGGSRVMSRGGPGSPEPSRWSCEFYPLKALLVRAFDVRRYEINGPGWLDTVRVHVSATLPPDTTREQFAGMLRNLIKERFGLAAHWEQTEVTGYELVTGKNGPKFQASAKAGSADAPPPGPLNSLVLGKDGFPVMEPGRNGTIAKGNRARGHWKRTTMGSLATNLAELIGRPVTDATGLGGEYDISLFYVTDAGMVESDPAGPSIFAAVQEQLGLKLEARKLTIKRLVVDHIEKVPVEN